MRRRADDVGYERVALTNDIHQGGADGPPAWLVFSSPERSLLEEYRVFTDLREARDFADSQAEDAGRDGWSIYPLWAGNAIDE
jgi:hypothetical protein